MKAKNLKVKKGLFVLLASGIAGISLMKMALDSETQVDTFNGRLQIFSDTKREGEMISNFALRLAANSNTHNFTFDNLVIDDEIVDLKTIAPNTSSLDFVDCEINDLSMLSSLTDLSYIIFSNCDIQPSALENLDDSLSTLLIHKCYNEQFEKIANLQNLEYLEVGLCGEFSYPLFSTVKSDLKSLTIYDCMNSSDTFDFNNLSNFQNLEYLHLHTSKKVENIDTIKSFSSLSRLVISPANYENLNFLSDMTNLDSLYLVIPADMLLDKSIDLEPVFELSSKYSSDKDLYVCAYVVDNYDHTRMYSLEELNNLLNEEDLTYEKIYVKK